MDLSTASLFICRWKKLVDRDHIGESRYYCMKAKRSRRRTFWTLRAHDRLSQQRMASVAFTPQGRRKVWKYGGQIVMWWALPAGWDRVNWTVKICGASTPWPPGSDRPALLRQWLTLRFIKWYLWTTIKWIIGTLSTITPWLMVGLSPVSLGSQQRHMAVSKRLAGKLEAARFGSSPKWFNPFHRECRN